MWGMVQIDILFLIVFTNVYDKRAEHFPTQRNPLTSFTNPTTNSPWIHFQLNLELF